MSSTVITACSYILRALKKKKYKGQICLQDDRSSLICLKLDLLSQKPQTSVFSQTISTCCNTLTTLHLEVTTEEMR